VRVNPRHRKIPMSLLPADEHRRLLPGHGEGVDLSSSPDRWPWANIASLLHYVK
jgi:hypothetical protein